MIEFLHSDWAPGTIAIWLLILMLRIMWARFSDPDDKKNFFTYPGDIPMIWAWIIWPVSFPIYYAMFAIAVSFKFVLWDWPKSMGDKRREKFKTVKFPEAKVVVKDD